MSNGKEIRGRVTSVCAVAALAVSLLNIGLTQAGAATTNPETDKAYGIINEDGTAKAGISSIADIKNNMTTTGADFVVDVDEDGHAESVLSPTEIRNLLDVSYAADARLERSLNDLYASNIIYTEAGRVDPSGIMYLTGREMRNQFPMRGAYYPYIIWSGRYDASNLPTSFAYHTYEDLHQKWTVTNQKKGLLGQLGYCTTLWGGDDCGYVTMLRYRNTGSDFEVRTGIAKDDSPVNDSIFTLVPLVD